MKNSKFLTFTFFALSAAVLFTGCGKSSSGSADNETMQTYVQNDTTETESVSETIGEIDTADENNEAKTQDGKVTCKLNSVKDAKVNFADTSTKLIIANLTLTNNTDEDITPGYLSYFYMTNDGEIFSASTLRAELNSNKAGNKVFEGGIKPGETKTSDFYLEIPMEHGDLQLNFCPYGDSLGTPKAVLQYKIDID